MDKREISPLFIYYIIYNIQTSSTKIGKQSPLLFIIRFFLTFPFQLGSSKSLSIIGQNDNRDRLSRSLFFADSETLTIYSDVHLGCGYFLISTILFKRN